ncbi:plastocyanin/azurin family copper-binding protein [Pseudoteredinibacter isoporae]|uniref:Plastocyanin n=1 Tax=Pseudoteredinibacter isoporae TaxID=570281 RepID=A0A7X0JQF9_9GAMM|nr:plastocyanin/azurin family copper-binding protein [Pseudoteredinibacter isoporae]MBB6520340.1 plastocyanin [Pseudoteredinibacter isoporae]NHO85911.1 methylamine utilization protein [Pseudoteredinibacter isoporae]NIB25637.1 methylamine utilization protein [Pseudoteredinibacter isoporae]
MKFAAIVFSLGIAICSNTYSDEHEVGQKNKAFSQKTLKVKVGDVVHFTNQDPFFHNVYSMSETTAFDLGSYAKGSSKSVKFEKQGEVVVQCAIHPFMKMKIKVEK